jgi:hypothetical protein
MGTLGLRWAEVSEIKETARSIDPYSSGSQNRFAKSESV